MMPRKTSRSGVQLSNGRLSSHTFATTCTFVSCLSDLRTRTTYFLHTLGCVPVCENHDRSTFSDFSVLHRFSQHLVKKWKFRVFSDSTGPSNVSQGGLMFFSGETWRDVNGALREVFTKKISKPENLVLGPLFAPVLAGLWDRNDTRNTSEGSHSAKT